MSRDFDKFKAEITVTELAAHYGYAELKAKTTKRWPVLYNAQYDDRFLLPADKFGKLWKEMDTGAKTQDIISFVSSRLDTVFAKWKSPEVSSWQSVKNCLNDYLGLSPDIKQSNSSLRTIDQSELNAIQKEFNEKEFFIRPLIRTEYLIGKRELSGETVRDERFKNKVLNSQFIKDGVKSSYLKTAFPFQTSILDEKYVGLSMRDAGPMPKLFASGTDRNFGVWVSNPIGKINKIHIVESEIDALSHYELNAQHSKNSLYISVGGNLTLNQIQTIKNITEELKSIDQLAPDYKYILNFDNNVAGSNYDNAVIQYIENETPEAYTRISAGKNSPELQYLFYPSEKNEQAISFMKDKFEQINTSVRSKWKLFSSDPTPSEQIFNIKKNPDNSHTVTFPKNKCYEIFNRVLIPALNKTNLIEIEKSKFDDYNEDLKERNKIHRKLNQDPEKAFNIITAQEHKVTLNFNKNSSTTIKI